MVVGTENGIIVPSSNSDFDSSGWILVVGKKMNPLLSPQVRDKEQFSPFFQWTAVWKLNSSYYVHFRTDIQGKVIKSLIFSAMGWIPPLLSFNKDDFGIK